MATTAKPDLSRLTQKQRRVHELLQAGHRPAAIAKRMHIAPSGVYNHMRGIRKRGVALPNEQLVESTASTVVKRVETRRRPRAAAPKANGSTTTRAPGDMVSIIKSQIDDERARLGRIRDERSEIETRANDLLKATAEVEDVITRHMNALAVYEK